MIYSTFYEHIYYQYTIWTLIILFFIDKQEIRNYFKNSSLLFLCKSISERIYYTI